RPSSRLARRYEVRAVDLLSAVPLEAQDLDVAVVLAGNVQAAALGADLPRKVVVRAQVRQPRLPDVRLAPEDVGEGAGEGGCQRRDEVVDLFGAASQLDAAVVGTRAAESRRLRLVLRPPRRGPGLDVRQPALEDLHGRRGHPRLNLSGRVVRADLDFLLV